MNTLGIIAEYNPLHNGHLYQLNRCKEEANAEFVIVIMSGNFTQRGEAAILDKWTRSRLAVEHGADLVLELPFAYAVNSAEHFAKGGIGILNALGCVTHLGFGAEAESLEQLQQVAEIVHVEDESFQQQMKYFLAEGLSYAKAREKALQQKANETFQDLLRKPNNILAIEYLKQLKIHKSPIKPIMVNRKGAGYHSTTPEAGFASATAIRNHICAEERREYVPQRVDWELENAKKVQGYFPLIQAQILSRSAEDIAKIFSVGEGLENRMKEQIRKSGDLETFIENTCSKRYPKTRIRRILCQMMVGLIDFQEEYYARLLAASSKGTGLLKKIKKTSEIPVITNINKEEQLPSLIKYDILASDLYNILTGADLYKKSDYVVHPFIQKG